MPEDFDIKVFEKLVQSEMRLSSDTILLSAIQTMNDALQNNLLSVKDVHWDTKQDCHILIGRLLRELQRRGGN